MITGPVSNEELLRWQELHKLYKDKLSPNRKSGSEVIGFLKNKYSVEETTNENYLTVVSESVLCNDFLREKLPEGMTPTPVCFFLKNEGAGADIYAQREGFWENCPVFVGIDLSSGYIHVEGSSYLYDELFAFQGLDKYDLENYVLTANYIECLKQFNPALYDSIILTD